MNKLYIFLLLLLSATATRAQQCADCRYVAPIFDSITMTTVQYGQGVRANGDTQQLYMDIYQPYGDTVSARPVAIFAFGGAFIKGARDDWYVKLVCEHLASAGYVAVSIDYRIYDDAIQLATEVFSAFPPQQMRVFFRPMQDMRGAIQYMKADFSELGNNYRIDTAKILIGGASSGAITSLMTAYCDKDSEMASMGNGSLAPLNALGGFYSSSGFYPNYSWHVAGTFNVSGALINADWIEPGDVPVICAHGDADQIVPYKDGGLGGLTLGNFNLEGSYIVDSVARAKGVCSYLYTMEGRGHPSEDMGVEYFYSVVYRMALRMKAIIMGQSFCCPLQVDVTPGDTLFYGPDAPATTLSATLTNDNGGAQLQWCSMPCHYTSTDPTFTLTPDSTWKYVAALASEGNCLSGNLYIIYDSTLIPTAVREPERLSFLVYPQPANTVFHVAIDLSRSKSKTGVLTLFDASGREVSEQRFSAAGNYANQTVEVAHLPSGSYYVTVRTTEDGQVGRKRVVILH